MRVIVFTPVWKRPEVTQAYALGIQRLRKLKSVSIDVLCVVSPEDDTDNKVILDKYKIPYVEHSNNTLGAKKNYGLQCVLKKRFDYLMELNSDDIVKDQLFEYYIPLMEKHEPFIGLANFAFYDSKSKRAKECKSSTLFGIGRMYRKDILKAVSLVQEVECHTTFVSGTLRGLTKRGQHLFIPVSVAEKYSKYLDKIGNPVHKLWDDTKNNGMDIYSRDIFKENGIEAVRILTPKPLAFDIKSELGICKYDDMPGSSYSVDELFDGLSKDEIDAIQSI